jgi:hypothetical protein
MSKLARIFRLILLLTFSLISATQAIADTEPTIGTFKDWNDLDQVEIKQLFKLSDYGSVTIEPFDTKEIEIPAADDNTSKPVIEAQSLFNERFIKKIQGELESKPVLSKIDATQGKVLLVRGKLITMNPGAKSARFFAGFGAGHAKVEIKCEIVDAKTNTVLATLTQARLSSGGWLGGSYEGLLEDLTEEVAEDTASLINHFN